MAGITRLVMTLPLYKVRSCRPSERITLTLLRKAAVARAPSDDTALSALVETAGRHGWAVADPAMRCLSDGETRLLAHLASCQRITNASVRVLPPELFIAMIRCADELAGRSIVLPSVAMRRMVIDLDGGDDAARPVYPRTEPSRDRT